MFQIRSLIGAMPQQMDTTPESMMVNHEHEFKTILDGLLTALSDLKLLQEIDRDINVIVIPEFQVGGGRRVDLAVQTIERVEGHDGSISYNNGVLVLMELKLYDNIASPRNFLNPQLQGSQLLNYIRSKNLKALTDGGEVVILPVAFIRNDGSGRCTINIPTITDQNGRRQSVFIAGQVVHSSLQEFVVDPLAQRLSRIA